MSGKEKKRLFMCQRKIRYTDRFGAFLVWLRMASCGETTLRIYNCRFCGGHHIGNRSTTWKQKKQSKKETLARWLRNITPTGEQRN